MLSDERIEVEHERELAEQQDSLTVGMQPMTEENMAKDGWVRGPLYQALNYDNDTEQAFMDLFEKHGLYFEYGYAWSLSAYEN